MRRRKGETGISLQENNSATFLLNECRIEMNPSAQQRAIQNLTASHTVRVAHLTSPHLTPLHRLHSETLLQQPPGIHGVSETWSLFSNIPHGLTLSTPSRTCISERPPPSSPNPDQKGLLFFCLALEPGVVCLSARYLLFWEISFFVFHQLSSPPASTF